MNITVAICTWNRARLLDQTLAEMHKLTILPGLEWEMLVVNNNCTDSTDEVISRHLKHLPIRRLFEPQPGQSIARNLAVCEAKGEYILWTDDDVLVDEDWISEYCRAFSQWPDGVIFGGPIQPWFAEKPPRWLHQIWARVAPAYATRDLGDKPIPFTQDQVPFGANFAVRTRDQIRYAYDPSLGLKQGNMLRGDETTLVRTMLSHGAKGWWVPRARVRHYISRDRQTTRYLRRFFSGQGEFRGRNMPDVKGTMLFGRPRWWWRKAIEAEARYRLHRVLCKPEVWIEDLIKSSSLWGQLRGYACRVNSQGH